MARRAPAKLSRPRLFNAVLRERLFRQLDACLQRPITFVVGPPGAGKTTLLASYVATRDRVISCRLQLQVADCRKDGWVEIPIDMGSPAHSIWRIAKQRDI